MYVILLYQENLVTASCHLLYWKNHNEIGQSRHDHLSHLFLIFSISSRHWCDGFVALKDASTCWLVKEGCGTEGGQQEKFDFYRKRCVRA